MKPRSIQPSTSDFYLKITNPTPAVQPVSLFNPKQFLGGGGGGTSTINYAWDFTQQLAYSAALPTLQKPIRLVVLARTNVTGSLYQQFVYNNGTPFLTVNDILTGLNTLGIGAFTILSGNIIQTTTLDYIFSSITLSTFTTSSAIGSSTFNTQGTLVYDPGFTASGLVGTVTAISAAVAFWINNPANTANGPLNREGLCTPSPASALNLGFFTQLQVGSAGPYFIGFSANENIQVFVNNTLVASLVGAEIVTSKNNIFSQTGITQNTPTSVRPFWYIIPVNLVAGNNIIQAISQDGSTVSTFSTGMEIYNNTKAQILASTGYADLTVLFKSVSLTGQNLF